MQTKEGQPRGEGPRSIFQFGDTQVDIFKALDDRETDIRTRNWRPGDVEALSLLRQLGSFEMTADDYRRATPKLFALAARPEGGYDRDYLAVVFQEIDRAVQQSEQMDMLYPNQRRISRFWGEHETMLATLSRAYGRIEFIKEHIWDNPKMKDEKQKIVESARQHLGTYHSHLPDLDDPA